MKVGVIVQARMNSRRCPGKVLRPLGATTVLGQLLANLSRCRRIAGVCVATSEAPADDPIADGRCDRAWPPTLGHPPAAVRPFPSDPPIPLTVVRGPLDDVAARFALAVAHTGWEAFVRISGDSPLLDYRLVDEAVELLEEKAADLVTNVWPRSFPRGQSVEALRADAFHRGLRRQSTDQQREHVTPYYYQHPADFRIVNFRAPHDHSSVQLAIDTEEDYAVVSSVVTSLSRPVSDYRWPVLAVLGEDFRSAVRGIAV